MSIVFLTIPGQSKIEMAQHIARETGDLSAIIVQKRSSIALISRSKKKLNKEGFFGFIESLYYTFLLRFFSGNQERLAYFRAREPNVKKNIDWPLTPMFTDSVNTDQVFQKLIEIKPKLLVVWGSGIIEDKILETAEKCINLHMGIAPNYRGAIANQQALLLGDIDNVGATIHYISRLADAGDILHSIRVKKNLPVKEMFIDLSTRAEGAFLKTVVDLGSGLDIPAKRQNLSEGRNYLLKDWTPKIRYKVSQAVKAMEENKND